MGSDCTESLVNILCNVHKGLKIFHFNARSLNGFKLDEVRKVFRKQLADVICVSETWFNQEVTNGIYELNGYTLFRNDRVGRRGGGVAIYCRSGLKASFLCKSVNCLIEYLCIKISGNVNVLISCVYNPYRQFNLSPFFEDIANKLVEFDYYVVCGDFNINILCNDSVSNSFIDLVNGACLEIVNNVLPTRFCPGTTPSLIDMFLVSDLAAVVKFDQLSFISDHDLIFCCIDISITETPTCKTYLIHDFDNINLELLHSDLSSVIWSECWSMVTADEKLDWLMAVITRLFSSHVPLKLVRSKNYSTPWFTDEVLVALKLRNKLKSKWKKCQSHSNWLAFTKARNEVTQIIKSSKSRYFNDKLKPSLSTKQLWKNIRTLNIHTKDTSVCSLDVDLMSNYFNLASSDITVNCERFYCEIESPFEFSCVSEADILQHLLSISSNAVGFDGLSFKFIKLIVAYILPTLTHIFNHCLTTSTFPCVWKVATITPIAKKSNAKSPSDFRPISILPGLAKVFEKLIAKQINNHLAKNCLLSPLQSGFRMGHSCSTAIMKILDDVRVSFDSNLLTMLCLLDFSKAFDLVNHSLLCSKLKYYFHFSSTAVNLINNYLSNRMQRVRIGEQFSTPAKLLTGVPQGSILGPLLFVMYLNDLFSLDTNSTLHAYADDVQLYLSRDFSNRSELAHLITDDIRLINAWATSNCLMINTSKCMVLPIYFKRYSINDIPCILIDEVPIKVVSSVKNLGFVINNKLSCTDHVNNVLVKVYSILRCLRISGNFTPITTKLNLVRQLVLPHFLYFCTVYSSLDSVSLRKISVAFNNCVRYVYSLRRFDHIGNLDRSLFGVSVSQLFEIRNLMFLHRLLYCKSPDYLYQKLKICHSTRSAYLVLPKFLHLNSCRLFYINAIRLWNSLPVSIRLISGRMAFRKSLLLHYNSAF